MLFPVLHLIEPQLSIYQIEDKDVRKCDSYLVLEVERFWPRLERVYFCIFRHSWSKFTGVYISGFCLFDIVFIASGDLFYCYFIVYLFWLRKM